MKPRPKTGERRDRQQPLKIDKLPQELRDELQKLRNADGLTWLEIEERSPDLAGWSKASAAALALFPAKRIPHSNLQRWFDLRVQQVNDQILAETIRSQELAAAFAGRKPTDPDATLNALHDQIFALMRAVDANSQTKFINGLLALAHLQVKFQKNQIAQQLVTTEAKRVKLLEEEAARKQSKFEKETNDAAKKLGKGKAVTLEDINNIRERVFGLPPV